MDRGIVRDPRCFEDLTGREVKHKVVVTIAFRAATIRGGTVRDGNEVSGDLARQGRRGHICDRAVGGMVRGVGLTLPRATGAK